MKTIIITIIMLALMAVLVVADPICEFNFQINQNDQVQLTSYSAYDGKINPEDRIQTSKYVASIGNTNTNMAVSFYIPHLGEIETTMSILKLQCNSWKTLQLKKENKVIFEKDITGLFCNNDKVCGGVENYNSCTADCPKSGRDNYCTYEKDNICDPDCLYGELDCPAGLVEEVTKTEFATSVTQPVEAPKVEPVRNAVFIVGIIAVGVLIIILVLLIIYNRRKKSYPEQKFDQCYPKQ